MITIDQLKSPKIYYPEKQVRILDASSVEDALHITELFYLTNGENHPHVFAEEHRLPRQQLSSFSLCGLADLSYMSQFPDGGGCSLRASLSNALRSGTVQGFGLFPLEDHFQYVLLSASSSDKENASSLPRFVARSYEDGFPLRIGYANRELSPDEAIAVLTRNWPRVLGNHGLCDDDGHALARHFGYE